MFFEQRRHAHLITHHLLGTMGERKPDEPGGKQQFHWSRQLLAAGCILLGLMGFCTQFDIWRSG